MSSLQTLARSSIRASATMSMLFVFSRTFLSSSLTRWASDATIANTRKSTLENVSSISSFARPSFCVRICLRRTGKRRQVGTNARSYHQLQSMEDIADFIVCELAVCQYAQANHKLRCSEFNGAHSTKKFKTYLIGCNVSICIIVQQLKQLPIEAQVLNKRFMHCEHEST